MPYFRKLPSGKWQATVRHPSGKRITKTDPLKRVVAEWGRELEAQFARGEMRDPRAGRITVGEWYERWSAAHVVAATTRTKIEGRWRTHCEPKWATWPLEAVTRMEAQAWVRELEVTARARWGGRRILDEDDAPYLAPGTIQGIVGVMTSLFQAAVGETPPVVPANPFYKLKLPTIPPSRIVYFTREQHAAVLAAMRRLHPFRWEVMTDLAAHVGLRYGEIAGLAGDRVDWLRQEIAVEQVWTVHGMRDYPKSKKSFRTAPVPDWIMDGMSRLMKDRKRTEMVFAGPGSTHPWHSEWHRIWYTSIEIARTCWTGSAYCAGGNPCGVADHLVPDYPPHALRHTAASWLVMDGVDLYRVQKLLGHESYKTTERYAHLAPDANDKIRATWRRDARPTHGLTVIRGDEAATGA